MINSMLSKAGLVAGMTSYSAAVFVFTFLFFLYYGYAYERRKLVNRLRKLRNEAKSPDKGFSISIWKLSEEIRELECGIVSEIKLEK
ncbi:MAG: hypothetical protein MJ107_01580 [Lachnospiraceae bacterium]|nr:hypothetical protein [Lachnospiraceae bacterium]